MGLFSWFSETTRKSEAAAHIQLYFEVSQKLGVFTGTPAEAANRITELACNRAPALAQQWKGFVLAASVLAIGVMEDDLEVEVRDHCAMALAGMLRAAREQRHTHSYDEQHMLRLAQEVYTEFRRIVPSVPHQPVTLKTAASVAAVSPPAPKVQTSRDRERSMEELIRRMQTSS